MQGLCPCTVIVLVLRGWPIHGTYNLQSLPWGGSLPSGHNKMSWGFPFVPGVVEFFPTFHGDWTGQITLELGGIMPTFLLFGPKRIMEKIHRGGIMESAGIL